MSINLSAGKVSLNAKTVLFPAVLIGIVGILITVVFKEGYSRTKILFNELSVINKNTSVLEDRLELLTKLTEKLESADVTVVTLPEKNSVLWVLYQLRDASVKNNTIVSEIETREVVKGENGITALSFEVKLLTESLPQIFSLFKAFQSSAPISAVEEMTITQSPANGLLTVDTKINSYWAEFPTELVPLTEPITDLTTGELATLERVMGLSMPNVNILTAEPPVRRENPFN